MQLLPQSPHRAASRVAADGQARRKQSSLRPAFMALLYDRVPLVGSRHSMPHAACWH